MDIKNFLQSSYKKENFIEFIFNKFYGFEENDTDYETPLDSEQDNIQKYKFLGQVELDDGKEIGFFEFVSTDKKDIENNRVSLNNILKKKVEDALLDGAIAVFYNPTKPNVWRLSFIQFSYDENDKQQVTNLKRYTYVLGKNMAIKTAYLQLKDIQYPSMIELEKAFSVEAITEEFYKEIIILYNNLINSYLIYPNNNLNNKTEFSIRLIGRLLFIKFLNKKDLVPNNIFDIQNKYYSKILEPLFFEQLNTKQEDRKINYINNKIPFLNGGLFEPMDLDLYNKNETIIVEDEFFKEFYQHINKYNFTIDENSIEDSDLSIDPEMLGRVFENLLAEINDNTRESAQKATGSYYTPREIVEYMINESLLKYLEKNTSIDKHILKNIILFYGIPENDYEKTELLTALFKLKIIDPACGSGAFPIGFLQKIVKILELIDPNANIWFNLQSIEFQLKHKNREKNYIRKLSIIKNSIYGIDIHPMAVEISKLRAFLSLIVDEKIFEDRDNRGIETLPNLEFKFVCSNTLLPIIKENKFDELENELIDLKNNYFESYGLDKKKIITKYNNIIQSYQYDSILKYNPFIPKNIAHEFDISFMFDTNRKFDIVISNPPYKRIQGINKDISKKYKNIYQSATGGYDLYVIFTEQALKLVSDKGIVNFIMPDRWVNSAFGKGLRKTTYKRVFKLISFKDYKVFNASTYTSLIWLSKDTNYINYLELKKDLKTNTKLKLFLDEINDNDYSQIEYKNLNEDGWILTNKISANILNILNINKLKLNDIFERIYTGLQTSNDQVYFLDKCKNIDDNLISGFSQELQERVVIEKDFTKPILKGDDIHKYKKLETKKVVIFPYIIQLEEEKEKAILLSEEEISSFFPNGYEYLKRCEDILRNREKGKFNIDGEWYQFGRKQGMVGVEEEKILSRDISKGGDYSYDKFGEFYHTTTVYGYKKYKHIKESYKFYLSILNSKLMWWYLQQVGIPLAGGYYRYMPRYVENFPIPQFNNDEPICFEILVDYIIFLNNNIKDDINEYVSNEHIIEQFKEVLDAMIYELYFRKQFKEKNIKFIHYAKEIFKPIEDLDSKYKSDIINKSYDLLTEQSNKIRNNLILIDIEFKDIIIPIKRAFNV